MLRQDIQRWVVQTSGPGFTNLTPGVVAWLRRIGAEAGLVTLFVPHTSASLTVQENTDPDVLADLADALDRTAPRTHPYRHDLEGPDDMPAHVKAMLTLTSLSIPVRRGQLVLGVWQAIYLIEHRDRPHERAIEAIYQGTMQNDVNR